MAGHHGLNFLCHHFHRRAKFLQSQLHASLPHECPGGTTQNFCDFLAKPVCSGLTKGCHRNMEMFSEINRYTVWYTYNYINNTLLFRSKLYHRSSSWKVGFYGWTEANLHRGKFGAGVSPGSIIGYWIGLVSQISNSFVYLERLFGASADPASKISLLAPELCSCNICLDAVCWCDHNLETI